MKAKLHVYKATFPVHKIRRYGVTGQGHGMPCPCENMVGQRVDGEGSQILNGKLMKRDSLMDFKLLFFAASVVFFLPPQAARAEINARTADTLSITIENDSIVFGEKDRYYTHGSKLSWISGDISEYRDIEGIPPWMQRVIAKMPFVNETGEQRSVSVSLMQSIYTPENKLRTDLIVNDRPYAGLTCLGLGLHSKDQRRMDTLEMDIGIVGRHSYAEDAQLWIHDLVEFSDVRGWANQLHDEPIVNIHGERKWKAFKTEIPSGFGLDFIPHAGIALGNGWTGMNMGGQVRLGWNIPNDFGTHLIRPGSDSNAPLDDHDPRFFKPRRRLGMHLFFAVNGNYVARNILLDGNTFRDSHSVEKKPFVADFTGGTGIIIHRFKLTYSYVYRTKEFETQQEGQEFGSISLSFTF